MARHPPQPRKSRQEIVDAKQALVAREHEVLELRRSGHSWNEIAKRVGYQSSSSAYVAFQRALNRQPQEKIGEIRAMAHTQLTEIWRRVEQIALDPGPYFTQGGKLVRDDDGNPIVDKKVRLDALTELRRLQESVRKLHGIDAPSRMRVEVIPPEVFEADTAHMRQLIKEAEIAMGRGVDELPDAPGGFYAPEIPQNTTNGRKPHPEP